MNQRPSKKNRRIWTGMKAGWQLGLHTILQYVLYQLGLRTGIWRRQTQKPNQWKGDILPFTISLPRTQQLASILGEKQKDLFTESEHLKNGQYHLFEGDLTQLSLAHSLPLQHWTEYELNQVDVTGIDIKTIWEPARMGWAFLLGRTWWLSRDEKWPAIFWELFEQFLANNPAYLGPNWISAQEAGLRIIAMAFSAQVFIDAKSTTTHRLEALSKAMAQHACRIPPTLSYAKAQNNNHLISEAVGLLTAGILLRDHPKALSWKTSGWKWLNKALQSQIADDGTYCQHSINYHRLMLHLALWGETIAALEGWHYPAATLKRLTAATRWMISQMDFLSGMAPNLGPDDGANILPLAQVERKDFRPVAQAAARSFMGGPIFPPGAWDEESLWLGLDVNPQNTLRLNPISTTTLRLEDKAGWASLRAVHNISRPGHADQLHVEIWHNGQPIITDAGTFSYNLDPPWNNALARTHIHNTISINDLDQMTRAGKFLWLDWSQARIIEQSNQVLEAEHDGYKKLGITHRRMVKHIGTGFWEITDHIFSSKVKSGQFRVQANWLLPDGKYYYVDPQLTLDSTSCKTVLICTSPSSPISLNMHLIRCGEVVLGEGFSDPTMGWISPTYLQKKPAITCVWEATCSLPFTLITRIEISSTR